jgi:hypothetical protein
VKFFHKRTKPVRPAGGSPAWEMYDELLNRAPRTPSETMLVAFGELRTEVNNGGFSQYFINSSGDHFEDCIGALEATEQTELLRLLQAAVRVIGGTVPAAIDERRAVIEALSDTAEDALIDLDDEYFALEQSTDLDAAMLRLVHSS